MLLQALWYFEQCLWTLAFSMLPFCVLCVQVCNTLWSDIWICSPRWNTFPWVCYHYRPCCHWAPSDNPLVVDGTASLGDCGGTLWLSFPVEPFQLFAFIWRVSICIFFPPTPTSPVRKKGKERKMKFLSSLSGFLQSAFICHHVHSTW